MRLPFSGNFPITQVFGVNPAAYAQFGMKGHNGIDYGLPTGTPVVAATAGVAYVLSDPPGFGNYVQVIGKDYKTIYAHLQKATIANGTQVHEGQQIGVSGNTGNVYPRPTVANPNAGQHLHFGVKPVTQDNNNGFFGAIDPQPVLNQGTKTMPALDLARARVIAFGLLGSNGQDGKPNALNGERDADLNANHVGQDPFEEIWTFYNSAEGQEWISKRLPAIYQRASDLASQAQSQADRIDSLNKQLSSVTADLKSTQDALEAAREAAATEPPKDTDPPATTPETEPQQPTPAPTWFAGFVEWLKSLIKQSK